MVFWGGENRIWRKKLINKFHNHWNLLLKVVMTPQNRVGMYNTYLYIFLKVKKIINVSNLQLQCTFLRFFRCLSHKKMSKSAKSWWTIFIILYILQNHNCEKNNKTEKIKLFLRVCVCVSKWNFYVVINRHHPIIVLTTLID